jgi:hypothetical protein
MRVESLPGCRRYVCSDTAYAVSLYLQAHGNGYPPPHHSHVKSPSPSPELSYSIRLLPSNLSNRVVLPPPRAFGEESNRSLPL